MALLTRKTLNVAEQTMNASMDLSLSTAIIRFDEWMTKRALPIWSANGRDHCTGFAERLDFSGSSIETGFRRLRVIARQTAVFNKAARADPVRYQVLADRSWETLVRLMWLQGWGWASRIGACGVVIDREMDFYDQAFGLFALSCRMEATGDRRLLEHASECMRLIDFQLRGRSGAGWVSVRGGSHRDQNPHMHYLEALLHLYAQEPLPEIAERIEEILWLLERYMMSADCGAVLEHFSSQWTPDNGRSVHMEPGHQFEWYWLGKSAENLGFSAGKYAENLFSIGHDSGFSEESNLYCDACDSSGRIIIGNYRVWPQCEAIKAHAVHPAISEHEHQRKLARLIDRMVCDFLDPVLPGLWLDRIDPLGRSLVDHVPASTLYHLFEAWTALGSLR